MTTQIMSQKAGDLATYTEGYTEYAIERLWEPLTTYNISLPKYNSQAHGLAMVDNGLLKAYAREQAKSAWASVKNSRGVFIRVCPLNARPGVLESIPVHTEEELTVNLERIMCVMFSMDTAKPPLYSHGLCEPDGCIIVQPFIDAHASAVMAPGVYDAETGTHTQGYIVMGRDNDGVTAALDGLKIVLPISGAESVLQNLWKQLDMDPAHYELEFVSSLRGNQGGLVEKNNMDDLFATMHASKFVNTRNYITQLRGCAGHTPINAPPKGVTVQGFVPLGKVKVTEVFTCEGEMEDYSASLEERLRQKIQKGFVISHIDGNMASHAAAQARAYKVPYVIGEVNEGDTWVEPAGGWVVDDPKYKASPYDPVDFITEYKEGLMVGLHHWTRMYVHLGHHFHQFAAAPLSDPKTTAFLGGAYTGWLINATLAVALGEMRHASGQRRGNTPDVYGTLNAIFKGKWEGCNEDSGGYAPESPPENRQHYYYTMEKTPLNMVSLHGVFEWLVRMYKKGWGASTSYGGKNYMESVEKGQSLLLDVASFVAWPTEETLLKLISTTNVCKNAVHNNGMFFNKFAAKSTMDMSTATDGCFPDLNQMFNVYYAAQAAVHKRGVRPELHDVSDTLQYVLSRGPSVWRKTPIMLDEAAPELLKDSIVEIVERGSSAKLHSGGGEVTQAGNNKFVPCGHEDCSTCKAHMTTLEEIIADEHQVAIQDATEALGLSFLDMGLKFDMWPVQAGEGTSTDEEVWLIETVEGLKADDAVPDPDTLVKCFNVATSLSTHKNDIQQYVMKMISKIVARLSVEDRLPLLGQMQNIPIVVPKTVTPIQHLTGKSKPNGKGMKKTMIEFLTELQDDITQEE